METLTLRLPSMAHQEAALKNTSPMLTTMAIEKMPRSALWAVEIISEISTLNRRMYRKKAAKPIIVSSIVLRVSFALGLVGYMILASKCADF